MTRTILSTNVPIITYGFHVLHSPKLYLITMSRGSSVGISTGYGLDYLGAAVRVLVQSIVTSPYRPDGLWGPPNLLSNGYWG
jgi:hypothetical protein